MCIIKKTTTNTMCVHVYVHVCVRINGTSLSTKNHQFIPSETKTPKTQTPKDTRNPYEENEILTLLMKYKKRSWKY